MPAFPQFVPVGGIGTSKRILQPHLDILVCCNYDGYITRKEVIPLSISSRFSIAVHILALLKVYQDKHTTSEFMASSVGTNPVVVRRITRMLAEAGLIKVHAGVGGAELTRSPQDISLLEVYQAVAAVGEDGLFSIHDQPNPRCLVGGKIQGVLEGVFAQAQAAMEQALMDKNLQDIVHDLAQQKALRR